MYSFKINVCMCANTVEILLVLQNKHKMLEKKKFCLLIVSLKSTNLKELVIDVLNFVRNLCDLNGELFLLNLYLLVTFEYKSHFACFNILPQRLSAYLSEP